MNFTNKHIVLIIIAIIIIAFIYNYDVYIVQKNQPICKPIYVTKKILTPDEEKSLPKNITNKGTIIIPPPTPTKPLKIPANSPIIINVIIAVKVIFIL